MKRETVARLISAQRLCERAMLFVGVLMVLYIGIAVLGLVSSSARHYAAFMLFVMIMSGIAAFRTVIGERFGLQVIDDGFAAEMSGIPARTPVLVWVRAALAIVGTVLAVACAAYVLIHADRLERTAPFFEGLDLAMAVLSASNSEFRLRSRLRPPAR